MPNNLYELSTELSVINDKIADAEGEIFPEMEARLDAVSLAIRDKIQSIAKWTINIDSHTEAIDKEIDRLQHKKKMTENLNKRLQDYIRQSMQRAEISKIEYPTFTVSVVKNPPSVEVVSEEAVPNAYKTVKQVIQIDKRRIMDDLKAGQKVEGCSLIVDKTHLRIK